MYEGYITDIEGIKVGHGGCEKGITGCSVILCEKGATPGIDTRGGAPGTRETDIFKPEMMVDKIHAVVLTGGSAFGLDASSGVMKYLEDIDVGLDVGMTKVPIVSSAVIFDLGIGDFKVRPDFKMGYMACKNASKEENRQGNIGCGMGATVGKILGPKSSMKSGLGSATISVGKLRVSALVAVNSLGDIYDYRTNRQIAGVYDYKKNRLLHTYDIMKGGSGELEFSMKNTTIGVIGTNAILTKAQANKVSQMAHNGYARSINPVHTMLDGDTIFTMATNKVEGDINLLGTLAAEVMSMAISNAITNAKSIEGLYAFEDLDMELD